MKTAKVLFFFLMFLCTITTFAQDTVTTIEAVTIYGTTIVTPTLYKVEGNACAVMADIYLASTDIPVNTDTGEYHCFFADAVTEEEQNSYYNTFTSALEDGGFALLNSYDLEGTQDFVIFEQWDDTNVNKAVDMLFDFGAEGVTIFLALSN